MIGQSLSTKLRAAVDANLAKQSQVVETNSRLERDRAAAAGDDAAFNELHDRLTAGKAQLRALQDAADVLKGELAAAERREVNDRHGAAADSARREAVRFEREIAKRFAALQAFADWLPELAAHKNLVARVNMSLAELRKAGCADDPRFVPVQDGEALARNRPSRTLPAQYGERTEWRRADGGRVTHFGLDPQTGEQVPVGGERHGAQKVTELVEITPERFEPAVAAPSLLELNIPSFRAGEVPIWPRRAT